MYGKGTVYTAIRLFVCELTQQLKKLWVDCHGICGIFRLGTREKLIKYWKTTVMVADVDTVLISVMCGTGMRSAE